MKKVSLLAAVLLAGCTFFWSPGEDPNGKKLLASASQVSAALAAFHSANGRFPQSLSQLVPAFLPALPIEPQLDYQPRNGSLSFTYSPRWPQVGQVSCGAEEGKEFGCHGYI